MKKLCLIYFSYYVYEYRVLFIVCYKINIVTALFLGFIARLFFFDLILHSVFLHLCRSRESEEIENIDGIDPGAFCFDKIQKTISIQSTFSLSRCVDAVDVFDVNLSASSSSERTIPNDFSHNVEIKLFGGFDAFFPFGVSLLIFFEDKRGRQRL